MKARRAIKEILNYNIEAELVLCTADSAPQIVKFLYERINPDEWDEKYGTKEYYDETIAMTIVGPTASAIVFRVDSDYDDDSLQYAMTKQHAYIFAMRNENGGKLIRLTDYENREYFICGYLIWHEFIAEFLTRILLPYPHVTIKQLRKIVKDKLYTLTNSTNSDERILACAEMISSIMLSHGFLKMYNWEELRNYCRKYLPKALPEELIEIVFQNLYDRKKFFWQITEEFIENLGRCYSNIDQTLHKVENS